jgi:hypothetical protein
MNPPLCRHHGWPLDLVRVVVPAPDGSMLIRWDMVCLFCEADLPGGRALMVFDDNHRPHPVYAAEPEPELTTAPYRVPFWKRWWTR